ncbi:hypothetical protein [uncultured Alsobacter sp.]|uniref:hypothetical protein n=1 Tax=uncultured Alsobacter sp. TaxID=1748258 RepID=UPI0025D9FFFE|nr:hypothetical protein [uncultured Alsobacter sp.]
MRIAHGPPSRTPAALLRSTFGHEPLLAGAAMVIALSLVVTGPAFLLDARQFQGENVWLKPIKFQVALVVYLATLAAFARWLPAGVVHRRWYRPFSAAVVTAVVAELLWIGGAAMFGMASHYNRTTPFMARIYPVMGALAVLLTSASLVYGIAIARNPDTGLRPSLKLAVALGLVLTFVLTVPAAAILSSLPGHGIGAAGTGARIPVLGWSREAGDLRVAHFLASHALHILPLAGLLIAAVAPDRIAKAGVWLTGATLAGAVAFAVVQALSGSPFIPVT